MIKIKNIEQDGQSFYVTVDFPDAKDADGNHFGEDFTIQIPVLAIGSRMVMYNLATPDEALKAIVLEHARGTNNELPNPTSKEEAIALYEEDVKEAEIQIADPTNLENVLDDNLPTIQKAIFDRLPEELKADYE